MTYLYWPGAPDVPQDLSRAEQIPGGWIVDGPCGRPHLTGPGWDLWTCRNCQVIALVAPNIHQGAVA